MSLTQELEDKCENVGSKINLSKEFFDDNSNSNIATNNSDIQRPILRVGKPGKLIYNSIIQHSLNQIWVQFPQKLRKL